MPLADEGQPTARPPRSKGKPLPAGSAGDRLFDLILDGLEVEARARPSTAA